MFATTIQRYRSIAQALKSDWLRQVENPEFKHSLSRSLGLGEKSSIEYPLQINSQALLIMDDASARKQAFRLELEVIGTAALLFAAQHKDLILDAELLIHDLRLAGYRISEQVVAKLKTV
jgi:predicted nucleic acid-binding protein